jgi:hypothetical protein
MDDPLALVSRQRDAFNRKDVTAMVADLSDDYQWFRVTDEGAVKGAAGKVEVAERMAAFFKSVPYLGSTIDRVMVIGNYVVAEEKDSFQSPAGPKTQVTLGVYEIADGKLKRAWAFPVKG